MVRQYFREERKRRRVHWLRYCTAVRSGLKLMLHFMVAAFYWFKGIAVP